MLERTSACLDNGVRLSLRATKQRHLPRSRRLLHSQFWAPNHPDLDPALLHPPASAAAAASSDLADPPFLDFLYPAPTQAFIARLSQPERWSRKPPRLSPLRRYSSLVSPEESPSHSESTLHTQAIENTRRDLRAVLDSPRPDNDADDLDLTLERVRRLCNHLEDLDSDHDLRRRAVLWFYASDPRDDKAAKHAVDLFSDLPASFKDNATYRAAIAANLQLFRPGDAMHLHEEASHLPLDGSIGSESLMAVLIASSDWSRAIDVLQVFQEYTASSPGDLYSTSRDLDLWGKIRVFKNFDERLEELWQECQPAQRSRKSRSVPRHQLIYLYRALLDAWFHGQTRLHYYGTPDPRSAYQRLKMRHFFRTMNDDVMSTKLFESVILTLLKPPTRVNQRIYSTMVYQAFSLYQRSAHYHPSENLLMQMVDFWRDSTTRFSEDEEDRPMPVLLEVEDILAEWTRFHQRPSDDSLRVTMDTFARTGKVDAVKKYADLYKSLHPKGSLKAGILWPLVYVHAVLANPSRAEEQLRRLKPDYGVEPDTRCWNIVLHAYAEANDLSGAMEAFRRMSDAKVQPEAYTYGPLLNLYAKLGDVEQVIELLEDAKAKGVKKPTAHMLNSLIVALTQNDSLSGAQQALERAITAAQKDEVDGSLTVCFNTMLVAYTIRKDFRATMATYRRMADLKVPLDQHSYGALMQLFCSFRQPHAAHKILNKVMPQKNIKRMAFHYAIVMTGYITTREFVKAVGLDREMKDNNVRPTASSRSIALQALALLENEGKSRSAEADESDRIHEIKEVDETTEVDEIKEIDEIDEINETREIDEAEEVDTSLALDDTIEAYKRYLDDPVSYPRGNQPMPKLGNEPTTTMAMDVGFLLYIHGRRRSFKAVQKIFDMYQHKLSQTDNSSIPMMRLLTTLMSVHCNAGEFAEVDRYWELVRDRADQIRLAHMSAVQAIARADDGLLTSSTNSDTARMPFGNRFMLANALRYYIISQFSQSTPKTIISLFPKLLSQGYAFVNTTWNEYIIRLCQTSPPRALLAFTLVEKFMMRDWPGWITARRGVITNETKFPKRVHRTDGMLYIRTKYLYLGQLIPQYATMVHLAGALLDIRGLETSGMNVKEKGRALTELKRQVGSVREIRDKAPNALHAVQTMPKVVDDLQQSLIYKQR